MTKHEQILQHIEDLAVGRKISVRQIAKLMDVSEGTAYRAIKDAEMRGIVSTIERVGTVRIEKKQKKNIERLTFAEVVNVVDGTVLGGRSGLHKTLHKFVIGAMEVDAMVRYIDRDSLLIVGNREEVHRVSLEHGAAVLITGGFSTTEDVMALADRLELPIISSTYDTFTTASLINRAIDDRLIKKDILLVEDVLTSEPPVSIHPTATVSDWVSLSKQTGHERFPVVDSQQRVVGMLTAKDISGVSGDVLVERVMTKQPLTVALRTSVATAAHMMVWEGIELLPVLDGRKLVGVISRQDVIKALQYIQKQPQVGETIEDTVLRHFKEERDDERSFGISGDVTPQMTNELGGLSVGVLTMLINEAGVQAIRRYKNSDVVAENISIYFIKPIQIERTITVKARVIDMGRKFGKADIEIYCRSELMGKALFTAQVLER